MKYVINVPLGNGLVAHIYKTRRLLLFNTYYIYIVPEEQQDLSEEQPEFATERKREAILLTSALIGNVKLDNGGVTHG